MSVLIQTSVGDVTVDLFIDDCPKASENFLKLCKSKAYNNCLFFNIQPGFIAQTGDPTGTGTGGDCASHLTESAPGLPNRRMNGDCPTTIKHNSRGTISLVGPSSSSPFHKGPAVGSQFFFTLSEGPHASLDRHHTPIGEVPEGNDVMDRLDGVFVDDSGRPLVDIRVLHTHVLDDPFPDPPELPRPESPMVGQKPVQETVEERLKEAGEGAAASATDAAATGSAEDAAGAKAMTEHLAEEEAKSRATVLEMVGDLPDADAKPPDDVLFVCKLNPVTRDKDLEMLFSRFGKVVDCSIMRDKASGDSLGYGFVGFESRDACEMAYFKMNNVLVDDRRIKVDFSQSVAKLWAQSQRGGTMPRMGIASGGGRGGFRGGVAGLTQRGRIGGQVVDIRLKSSALGSATEAEAVSRTMLGRMQADEDRRRALSASSSSSADQLLPPARADRPTDEFNPAATTAGLAAAVLRARAIAARLGAAAEDAGGQNTARRLGRRDEDRS